MEKIQWSPLANDMSKCIENPKSLTQKLLKLVNRLSEVKDSKSTYKNQYYIYTLTVNYLKKKSRKLSISFTKVTEEKKKENIAINLISKMNSIKHC